MTRRKQEISRRQLLKGSVAAAAAVTIVPRQVLGGPGETPPSEQFGGALIGCGGRGGGTFGCLGPGVRRMASCDVKYKDRADNKTFYTDFRRVLERKDIHVVAVATHPGWHALISIAAMEAGKDVVCEKPMCRFIAEGRAVAEAEKRFGRIFQIENKGPYHANKVRKIFESGLLKNCDSV
ncbi:MAG: Gfo/Idh/MocA family protein, partial [Planctomycetota bacterium]